MRLFFYLLWKFAVRDKTESLSSEDEFVVLSPLEKRKRKYRIYPSLKQDKSKESSRCVTGCQWSSDMLLAILEPHIKKNTTNFRKPIDPEQWLAVCLGRDTHRDRLFSNNPLNNLDGYEKTQKNQTCSEKRDATRGCFFKRAFILD